MRKLIESTLVSLDGITEDPRTMGRLRHAQNTSDPGR
jgi:hypothetical protein